MQAGWLRETAPLWSEEALEDWKCDRKASSIPMFWGREGQPVGFITRCLAKFVLPQEWPVYVSHAEANAYGEVAGDANCRHESAFHRGRDMERSTVRGSGAIPGAREAPTRVQGKLRFQIVGSLSRWERIPRGPQVPLACTILVGNGWEWTRTDVSRRFRGFTPIAVSIQGIPPNLFSTAKHYVMKGGSPRHRGEHAAAVVPKLGSSLTIRTSTQRFPLRRGLESFQSCSSQSSV